MNINKNVNRWLLTLRLFFALQVCWNVCFWLSNGNFWWISENFTDNNIICLLVSKENLLTKPRKTAFPVMSPLQRENLNFQNKSTQSEARWPFFFLLFSLQTNHFLQMLSSGCGLLTNTQLIDEWNYHADLTPSSLRLFLDLASVWFVDSLWDFHRWLFVYVLPLNASLANVFAL